MSNTHPITFEDLYEVKIGDPPSGSWKLGTDGNFYYVGGTDQEIMYFDITGATSSKTITQPYDEEDEEYLRLRRGPQIYASGTQWATTSCDSYYYIGTSSDPEGGEVRSTDRFPYAGSQYMLVEARSGGDLDHWEILSTTGSLLEKLETEKYGYWAYDVPVFDSKVFFRLEPEYRTAEEYANYWDLDTGSKGSLPEIPTEKSVEVEAEVTWHEDFEEEERSYYSDDSWSVFVDFKSLISQSGKDTYSRTSKNSGSLITSTTNTGFFFPETEEKIEVEIRVFTSNGWQPAGVFETELTESGQLKRLEFFVDEEEEVELVSETVGTPEHQSGGYGITAVDGEDVYASFTASWSGNSAFRQYLMKYPLGGSGEWEIIARLDHGTQVNYRKLGDGFYEPMHRNDSGAYDVEVKQVYLHIGNNNKDTFTGVFRYDDLGMEYEDIPYLDNPGSLGGGYIHYGASWGARFTGTLGGNIYSQLKGDYVGEDSGSLVELQEYPYGKIDIKLEYWDGTPATDIMVSIKPANFDSVVTGTVTEFETDHRGKVNFRVPAGIEYEITASMQAWCHIPSEDDGTTTTISELVNLNEGYHGEVNYTFDFEPNRPSKYISTAEDLWNMRYCPGQQYHLMNDIDMEGFEQPDYHPEGELFTGSADEMKGFLPITDYWEVVEPTFSLDGHSHVIQNLEMNLPGANSAGLFYSIVSPAEIENLVLRNITVITDHIAGGIAGYSGIDSGINSIINCHVSGDIEGGESAGGIAGEGEGTEIQRCSFKGNVGGQYSGGIVGYAVWDDEYPLLVSNCFAKATITSTSMVGGLFGVLWGIESITNCYFVGELFGGADGAAPIGYWGWGSYSEDLFESCYYDADVMNLEEEEFDTYHKEEIPATTQQMTYIYAMGNEPLEGKDWKDYWEKIEDAEAEWEEQELYEIGDKVIIYTDEEKEEYESFECIKEHYALSEPVYTGFGFGGRPEDDSFVWDIYGVDPEKTQKDIIYDINDGYPVLLPEVEGDNNG